MQMNDEIRFNLLSKKCNLSSFSLKGVLLDIFGILLAGGLFGLLLRLIET